MKLQSVKISELRVNRSNDRHGELISETEAIDWLLTHHAKHMRNLTKDVVAAGEIYEPPLVRKEKGGFVVYDGNRRTTVLKLLLQPERAPSQDWVTFFTNQRKLWFGDFPCSVDCQIEQDRERMDEILYRRHTGQQNGVGQSQWNAEAKTNFERRTGKNTKIDLAAEVEALLQGASLLSNEDRLPRSNFKRLFSAEQFRNRVGLSVEQNKLKFTHQEEAVLNALARVAQDLISKKVTLDNIWDNESKRTYLDSLDKEGILPTIDQSLSGAEPKPRPKPHPKPKPAPDPQGEPKPADPGPRKTLIRNIDYGIQQKPHNRRAYDIFGELQHRLKFEEHDNAISVLFRVLVELAIEIYIEQHQVASVHKNDKLKNKFSKVREHMLSASLIDKKYHDGIKKFDAAEAIFSTSTMNSYVHNPDFFPSDQHLKSLWDSLEKFVTICMRA